MKSGWILSVGVCDKNLLRFSGGEKFKQYLYSLPRST